MLTKSQVIQALPAGLKTTVTDALVDKINQIEQDPIVATHIRENFISFGHVLKEGKFKIEDYLNAVRYVSFKLMNLSNQDAYFKTFPDRYQALVAKGTSAKDISAYVSAYHKGKLVNMIMEQSLVPTWVLNADLFQKALNTQAQIMLDEDVSPKVRSDAAHSIMQNLQKPKEAAGIKVDVTIGDTSGMAELEATLNKLAQTQAQMIAGGFTAKQIAAQPIIDAEVIDVEVEEEINE